MVSKSWQPVGGKYWNRRILPGGCKEPTHLPFFVLPPPFLCAASMSGEFVSLCNRPGLEALCSWQGLLPSMLLHDVSDSPVKAVSNILHTVQLQA